MNESRMDDLIRRMRKLVQVTMQRESGNNLSIGQVIEKQFFLTLQTNARVEALLEVMSDKLSRDAYNKAYCDKMEGLVEGFQMAMGVVVDNDGNVRLDRLH